MKLAIAFRHVAFEDLGTLEPVLRSRGFDLRYVDPTVDELDTTAVDDAELLVVLGGPVSVYDESRYPFLTGELRCLEHRLARGAPTLGLCLGAQLLARVLGARVSPMPAPEIGFAQLQSPSGPLATLEGLPVLHWHGDRFECPVGATPLAHTAHALQAFAFERHVLALQFHLELNVGSFERWLVGHAAELRGHGLDPRDLRAAARTAPPLDNAAGDVFEAWWEGRYR